MIDKLDVDNHTKLASVISAGQFDIKGSAVVQVALLLQWYDKLGLKLKKVVADREADKLIEEAKKGEVDDNE